MRKVSFFVGLNSVILFATVVLTSCGTPEIGIKIDDRLITIVSYNVQTFFDAEDLGTEYSEFTGRSSKWNAEKYTSRLNRLIETISSIQKNGPDILILQEIENEGILRDIMNRMTGVNSFTNASVVPAPGQSIMCGILSKFPIHSATAIQIETGGDSFFQVRPIIEAEFVINETAITVFACHWKSKRGSNETRSTKTGRIESNLHTAVNARDAADFQVINLRQYQAAAIYRRVLAIKQKLPETHIIIAGDLNEGHLENDALPIIACNGDLESFRTKSWKRGIPISGGSVDFYKLLVESTKTMIFYEPWFKASNSELFTISGSQLKIGSYYYKGLWNTIDHILFDPIFFDGKGAEFVSFSVYVEPKLIDAKTGVPFSYKVYNNQGYSDHFPVVAVIRIPTTIE